MKTTMNEYRILYRSDKFEGLHKVFILAKNDYEAEDIVMNTFEIPKHWIENISTQRLNVNVLMEGGNVNEIYEETK
tara:strand:+ start:5529 stop:5756 length:228 start_codon:yes stop_codon:yes gene_type:complete